MSRQQDQQQISHTNWVQSLGESRATCRKALAQASVDVSDPRRALWPAVQRSQMTREHQTVARCHAAVLDYAEHVEPFANRCIDIWTKQLGVVELPDESELDVCLDEIEAWADRRYELETRREDELTGYTTDTEYRRVHLPTKWARQCYRKLNDCIGKLGLAADLKTPDYAAVGPDDAL